MDPARILIVEDDAILATHLEETLIRLGYQVTGLAATGKSAVKSAIEQKPDAILMDIRLRGEMTGIQAAEEIHKSTDIPVIYLTAYTDELLVQQAKSTDAYAYLAKPVRDHELRASLEMALFKYKSEKHILHLNQVLRAVRNVNQLITRERDPQRLMEDTCNILVRTRDYKLVWIGEPTGDRLNPIASAGEDRDFIEMVFTTASTEQAQRLPGMDAFRTRQPVICHDLANDERYAPWREEIQRRNMSSWAAIPMMNGERFFGVLSVYPEHATIFDEDETSLLMELAGDLAFGLNSIEQELEHKQAEEKVRESQERYHTTLNNMMEGCQIIDYEWRYLYVNDAITKQGKQVPEELLMHTMMDVYPGIEDTDLFSVLRRCMEERCPERLENKFVYPDGTFGWFELGIQPVPEGLFILSLDITERKQAEETRLESERLYRLISENSADVIWIVDPATGKFKYVSPSVYRLRGYTPEEVMAQTLQEALTPESYDFIIRTMPGRIASFLEGDKSALSDTAEIGQPCKDGSIVPTEIVTTFITNEQGQLVELLGVSRNISERKQANELIRGKERHFRALTERAPDGIVLVGLDGKYMYASPSARKIFGYGPDELIDTTPVESTHPDDLPHVLSTLSNLIEDPAQVPTIQYRFKHSDGSWRWIESTFSNMLAESSVQAIVINFHDITERRRVESLLAKREHEFRTLAENSPDVIVRYDREGRRIYVNPEFERVNHLSAQEVQGKTPIQLSTELAPMADVFTEKLMAAMASGTATKVDLSWTKDGKLICWYVRVVPELDTDGKVASALTIWTDITERKQAEEALAASEAELRALFASMKDVVLVIDREGVYRKIAPTNPGLLYKPPEVLLGKNLRDVFPPEQAETFIGTVQQVLKTQQTAHIEYQLVIDGQVVWFETSISPMNTDSTLWVARDITERKRAEERIKRQVEHLTALNEIDRMIASSFDLHLSLTSIIDRVISQQKVDATDILIMNPDLNILEFGAGSGFHASGVEKSHLSLGEGYAGRAALERQTIHVADLRMQVDNPPLRKTLASENFVGYFAVPLIAKGKVKGVLEIFHRSPLDPDFEWLDFLNTLAGQASLAIDNATMFGNLQRSNTELALAYDATIEGLSRALDLRDKETEGHSLRVTEMAVSLASQFDLRDSDLVQVRRGALLHDIGKMGLPDSILLKPDPLTEQEWVLMKNHPAIAYKLLSPIGFLRAALDIPYCHHEKWDGTGYPRGLKGTQIPLVARIFAVADVWDALTSDRVYRAAWTKEKALDYIKSQAGTHFDPHIVDICFESGILERKNQK